MKKTFVLVSLLAAAVGLRAEDSNYLYWQVLADNVAADVGTYNTAYFYALSGDGTVERTPIGLAEWSNDQTAGARTDSAREGVPNFSGYENGYSGFLFELAYWDGTSDKVVGSSETYTFAQLAQYMTSFTPGTSGIPTQNVFAPSFAAAVPEPTSGLLMLLGVAGLALRRRRA